MKNSFSIVDFLLSRPYFIISFLALFLFLGLVGYNKIDRKLFPDSNYPTVAVVIVEPGESAKGLAANVSIPVEEELYTLDQIRRVYSTTIDEVSVISAEFEYTKDIDSATSDVSNALDKIRAKLPAAILNPQIIKITEATAPIVTYAVSAKEGNVSLEDIRQIVQTQIKHKLIKVQGVANVDVFGGYEKEIEVIVDKEKLERYNLDIALVVAKLRANNNDFAIGFITGKDKRYLLRAQGKRDTVAKLKKLSITKEIQLQDIANVYFGHYDNSAEYYGNSKNAIAIAVQRTGNADVIRTIARVEKEIQKLQNKYKNLSFVITDTQKDTIVQSTNNMFESLRDAIIMSTLVVFFFLASFRQVLVVLVTIPLVYATTIALMWIIGIEFNVVTLTAIILALGLLLDDAVVVMENIERHYRELHDEIHKAVYNGTKEIMFADLSGTITTMIALSPMLFVGGYPQTIFQPLVATLLLALAASYVISITAVPLLSLKILTIKSPFILKSEAFFEKITGGFSTTIADFFVRAVSLGVKKKSMAFLYTATLLFLFFTSVKGVMPTVGQELMPPMDTGGVRISITVDPNLPIEASKKVVEEANKIITKQGNLLYLSSAIGSEAGVMSIGSGSSIDHISISATYVDRYKRKESIWQIERKLREALNKIKNVNSVDVVDYGATAIASLRANIDVTLSSDDLTKLQKAGDIVEDAMQHTGGVVSVSRTWLANKRVYEFSIDEKKAAYYGLSNEEIAKQLQLFVRGVKAASFYLQNSADFGIRVWVDKKKRESIEEIKDYLVTTKKGKIPLRDMVKITMLQEPSLITREGLQYTLNVYGFREKAAISHIMANFDKAFDGKVLPDGVTMEQTGDIKQFKNSAGRMVGAIGFAVILILFTLVAMFNSVKISMMIVFSIPLTIIGASWMMLFMHYHTSMPAMMGFILLSGIIVNNAILLIHFALEKMKEGYSTFEAMVESIKIRTRPVLMTAFATSAGMLPVALGSAIGLERLAPLGTVAIGGLIVGTFLTLLFIPLVFIWSVKEKEA
ncbi:efflux RND transporter permease subunit [Sulfurimonas sp. SWIR-19]|uniref:efflux RND transporter permease subunit n=1 Tax=Sulfurimonas sp. SWIR-19 TaxID=2878390 RepID=UPI001CF3DB9D|nr:efflux RND transporter permease subunit [Sulfurimonas sp. SWIR-19]UCN01401.1 efflux RND transporter permease subunit [Sulfurimonas sp. SWIR-19]